MLIISKKFLAVLVAICLVLAAGSYAVYRMATSRGAQKTVITFAECAPAIYLMPHHMAEKMKFYGDSDIILNKKQFTQGAEALRALEQGELDMALVKLEDYIYHLSRNQPGNSNLMAVAALSSGSASFLLASEARPDFKWEDLKGKVVISGGRETLENVMLEEILARRKLTPNMDLNIYYNIPEELKVGAMRAKTGDYLVLREPQASLAADKGLVVVASLDSDIGKIPSVVLVVGKNMLAQRPGVVQTAVNAMYQGQIWLKYHSDAEIANKLPSAFKQQDQKQLAKTIKVFVDEKVWGEDPMPGEEYFQETVALFNKSREIPREVKAQEALDSSFAATAISTVNYIPEDKKPKRDFPYSIIDYIFGR